MRRAANFLLERFRDPVHGGFFHILFNMFGLYMFGSELEQIWGTRQFTKYFFICGIGAAITTVLADPSAQVVTIGASGAIFGILLAYGLLFPSRIIYLYMVIPIQAKWFVVIMGAITFLSSMSATGSGIAYNAATAIVTAMESFSNPCSAEAWGMAQTKHHAPLPR